MKTVILCLLLCLYVFSVRCVNVVFIHGGWSNAATWDYVKPHLHADIDALYIDFPSFVLDTLISSGFTRVPTRPEYVAHVEQKANERWGSANFSIVAHSIGGLTATLTANALAPRVERVVLLSAFLLFPGENVITALLGDPNAKLLSSILFNEDGSYRVNRTNVDSLFFNQLKKKDIKVHAYENLNDREVYDGLTPISYVFNAWLSSVKFSYIKLEKDNALTLPLQNLYASRVPLEYSYSINTDHFPQYSKPKRVAHMINNIFGFPCDTHIDE